MSNKIYKEVYDLISQYQRILIMPSSPPDGDSLGSSLALYLVLKKLGKEVTVVCSDPVPESFKFLPTANVISDKFAASSDFIVTLDCARAKIENIETKIENNKVNIIITPKEGNISERGVSFSYGPTNYELIIVVDTGDLQQLGRFYEDNTDLFTRIPLINIDHHTSNSQYGKINLVDIMAPSTTEIITHMIESWPNGKEMIDEDIATLLLAGIITDTGSFQNANTTPRAFAGASHLLGYGARQQEIIQHVYKTKNLSTLKLWGRVLSKIKTDDKYKMVWSVISQKDLEETSSHQDETGDIIDELMTNAPGAEIVMLIKEKEKGLVSVSVRTTHAGVDASALAESFGGGGHVQAAGFRVKSDDVYSAENEIIEKVKQFQAKRLFIEGEDMTGEDMTGEDMTGEDMTGEDTRDETMGDEAMGDEAMGDEAMGHDTMTDDKKAVDQNRSTDIETKQPQKIETKAENKDMTKKFFEATEAKPVASTAGMPNEQAGGQLAKQKQPEANPEAQTGPMPEFDNKPENKAVNKAVNVDEGSSTPAGDVGVKKDTAGIQPIPTKVENESIPTERDGKSGGTNHEMNSKPMPEMHAPQSVVENIAQSMDQKQSSEENNQINSQTFDLPSDLG